MKKIIIPIHSFIDVVTNSSTSIYVGCHGNTIKYAKELIDDLLKVAKSDKKSEDLFEFKITADFESESSRIIEDLEEYYPEREDLKDLSWGKQSELAKEVFLKIISGEIKTPEDFGENFNGYDTRILTIKAKDDDEFTINLTERISNIFSIDGERDG